MKIDRLMGIVIYLLNNGKTSAQVLAGKFEVSPRTIVRDIATLEQAGIPVVPTCGADGGYQILDTYVMDRQLADNQDYSLIYTALKGLASAYDNKDIERTINKISLMPKKNSCVALDFSAAHENRSTNKQIQMLEDAIEKRKTVEFEYTNSEGMCKTIQTDPVGVVYKWYNWYLIGYYEKYADYCMFKLVRMQSLRMGHRDVVVQHSLHEALRSCGYSPNSKE